MLGAVVAFGSLERAARSEKRAAGVLSPADALGSDPTIRARRLALEAVGTKVVGW